MSKNRHFSRTNLLHRAAIPKRIVYITIPIWKALIELISKTYMLHLVVNWEVFTINGIMLYQRLKPNNLKPSRNGPSKLYEIFLEECRTHLCYLLQIWQCWPVVEMISLRNFSAISPSQLLACTISDILPNPKMECHNSRLRSYSLHTYKKVLFIYTVCT